MQVKKNIKYLYKTYKQTLPIDVTIWYKISFFNAVGMRNSISACLQCAKSAVHVFWWSNLLCTSDRQNRPVYALQTGLKNLIFTNSLGCCSRKFTLQIWLVYIDVVMVLQAIRDKFYLIATITFSTLIRIMYLLRIITVPKVLLFNAPSNWRDFSNLCLHVISTANLD